MNDRPSRDAALNDPAFLDLIAAWHDNLELSAERQAELLARLRDDPALRRHLAEQIGFDGLVRAVQAPEARWLKLEDRLGTAADDDTAMEDAVMAAIAGERSLAADRRAGKHRSSRAWLWSPRLFAAALAFGLVIAGGIVFVASQLRGKTEPPVAAEQAAAEPVAEPQPQRHLATVTKTRFLLAANSERPLMAGLPLAAGRVAILGGAVELTIRNGVVIVLEGPGDIELKDDMQAFLHDGSAVVRVPKGMSGFRLDTASTDVLDLGTEFAVRVLPDRQTDVQVYDGAVVATGNSGAAGSRFPQRLEMGQAARFSPSPEQPPQPIAYAEERFVRRIESDPGIDLANGLPPAGAPDEARDLRRLFGAPRHESIAVSRPARPIVIDGRLDDWQSAKGFTSTLDDSDDTAEWIDGRMMYDDECLYIAASVGDPAPLRNTFDPAIDALAAWRGGGLQVRVSTDREQGWPVVANSPNYFSMRKLVPTPEQKAAAENPRLAHLTMWFHAPSKTPCLTIAYGMLLNQIAVNPSGFRGAFAPSPGGRGYTLEYAIPWRLLNCDRDPPQPGDTLAAAWQVTFSDEGGRLWRDQIVELRNAAEPPRIFVWERAATWGRAEYQP
jgi:hypothetical protein